MPNRSGKTRVARIGKANPLRLLVPVLALAAGIGCWFAWTKTVGADAESPASNAKPAATLPTRVEFDRHIRPILSDACYACHGPDAKKRKGELRLDTEDDVFRDRNGTIAVVPGKVAESELFTRISSTDPEVQMPPPTSGKKISPDQVALIRRWIEQGATWQKHWSFVTPVRPNVPRVSTPERVRNPIDAFVLARLEQEGLSPALEAGKSTLIRRVSLDLTGLPPTPDEVDAFLADASPNAYEKVVDRLLASERYGERMASQWLDAARYADTSGYQTDGERFMWRWRDWVIDAYNQNMPFNQFTIEQLAGDLLPAPTLEQRIATGFNRNHRGNGEGGVIPEEFAVEYVIDRVETTSTVWLGLTLGCVRCHEHKYDPFSQQEFYGLYAFFNSIPEKGRANKYGNSAPLTKAPTKDQRAQLADVEQRLSAAEARFTQWEPKLAEAQAHWETSPAAKEPAQWTVNDGLEARYELDGNTQDSTDPRKPSAVNEGEAIWEAGIQGQAARFDGTRSLDYPDAGHFGFLNRFTLAAWVYADDVTRGTILSRMIDEDREKGYQLAFKEGKLHLNLVARWLDDAIRVETAQALEPKQWYHVAVSYDGSREAKGIHIYVDGEPVALKINLDAINQDFLTDQPFRIGSGGGPESRFRGLIDDVHIFDRVLDNHEVGMLATLDRIDAIVATPSAQRSPRHADKLAAYFLEARAPDEIRKAWQAVKALRAERARVIDGFPTVMVMEELPQPRPAFVLVRGEYDKPGQPVERTVPRALSPWPANVPRNRLGLAQWLVDPANPLTARVVVNRYWQMLFGTGLVKTVEDFGSQGERPSHPQLLDWLATEYTGNGWDTKALLKTIVMSGTYRQSSKVTPALWQKDPENRLLARGPRLRLDALEVRDQALYLSGLLVEKLGGPSVKPYQPEGLWKELSGDEYVADAGDGLYRRSLYTFWRRTATSPTMTNFDASARETCTVRATRTNTPLQALTLLNDVTFVEASRALAQRVMLEKHGTVEETLSALFRRATARTPSDAEARILANGFQKHLERYRANAAAARELIHVGQSQPSDKLDAAELASYTAIAGLILNLDEVVTKE